MDPLRANNLAASLTRKYDCRQSFVLLLAVIGSRCIDGSGGHGGLMIDNSKLEHGC